MIDPIGAELVSRLYAEHRGGLDEARRAQRALLARASSMQARLDDVEAEITYLLLRHVRPTMVVELGALDGWSTSWILRALRDNGSGGCAPTTWSTVRRCGSRTSWMTTVSR